MPKIRWTLDQKKHHVTAWRSSGLTREQYCDLYDIPFKSLRQWPQDVALAERRAKAPEVIPISVSAAPVGTDTVQQPPVANDPVTLHLPGGIRMCCHPSQLTDVFRALRYADS
ncbi:IS66 family insertion sequence element accessory protein TnpA [Enterobacter ludwigii]|uniref:IS66 family insertion sequence element accessory protein TnpA n=1 Tax=Enterobacter ludwigii TaxID=299767 RepID=UPI003F72DDC9